MMIEKLLMTVTTFSFVASSQLLIDIPGMDLPDMKDIPGLCTPVSLDA